MGLLQPVFNPSIAQQRPASGFFHPWLDVMLLGGLGILLWSLLQGAGYIERSSLVIQIALAGSFLVNYPHYAATYYRVYQNSQQVKSYPFVSVILPVILLLISAACFWLPQDVAPLFCKIFLLISGYHYSGQTYGIALIYSAKAGFRFNLFEKLGLALPIYFSYLAPTLNAESSASSVQDFYGVSIPPLGLPTWVASAIYILFNVSLFSYIGFNLWLHFCRQKRLPWIVHLVIATQIVWYIVGSGNAAFYEFVPFFHCLQYLVITTYFHCQAFLKGQSSTVEKINSPLGYLKSRHFGRYYLLLIIFGSAMFYAVPQLISLAGISTLAFANAIVISFLNLHHFFLDGAIWKLRKPAVSQVLVEP